MTPALRSAAIEAMARAKWELYAGLNFIPAGWPREWDQLSDFMKAGPLRDSTIELDALRRLLDERGCVVAPRVATEVQMEAANGLPITATVNGLIGIANAHGMNLPPPDVDGTPLHQWYAAMIAAITTGGDALGEDSSHE